MEGRLIAHSKYQFQENEISREISRTHTTSVDDYYHLFTPTNPNLVGDPVISSLDIPPHNNHEAEKPSAAPLKIYLLMRLREPS